jgi:PKD repeat protein
MVCGQCPPYSTQDFIDNPTLPSDHPFRINQINFPEQTWKVAVILNPGETIADITTNTTVVSIITPNEKVPPGLSPDELEAWRNWRNWRVSVDYIETETGLDLLSNIPKFIQDNLESHSDGDIVGFSTSLLADFEIDNRSITPSWSLEEIPIFHRSLIEEASFTEVSIETDSIFKTSINQNGFIHINRRKDSSFKNISGQNSFVKVGVAEISINTLASNQFGFTKVGMTQVGTSQINSQQFGSAQVSMTEIDACQVSPSKQAASKINSSKIDAGSLHLGKDKVAKITLPSSISSQQGSSFNQFSLSSHSSDPQLTSIYSTAQSIWHTTTDLNLNFEITNLPTGQLAEATITGYDQLGRPNAATISIDDDANGVGWFLDTTPQDNSEFTGTDTYLQATPNSPASDKYDLLTAILHEMGHTLGFINGYSQFNQNIKGRQFYTDSTHSYTLSSDLSHLDNTHYPNDLLNTNLKPGIRKLPSTMDWAIINAINSGVGSGVSGVGTVNPAHLTAGALIGITNGDFTTSTTWNTLGATNIINGTATLTEQSQKLSELTQAFIIPTGAKTLQFNITDNHLITGDTTKTANDAFEVALLDTNTFNPLVGTSIGLNHTDSLLNIQANGTIHKSDKVTITALGNNSSIVTIDLTQVTPTTQATLYFNLLGFGARTSTITIDDVKLFTDTQPLPITKNDTLATTQNTPLTFNPTTNDTNVNTIQIINQPTHGTLTQTPDGKLTYTPIPTYIGNDSFKYIGIGTDGQISNLATVNLTVNNLPPTIETLTIPTKINEGQTIQLSATATDGGSSDNLTYTWNLGDGSQPVIGQNIAHQFVDNGTYNINLTVTDFNGSSTQQSTQITVDNLAPTLVVDKSINTNINQGETITFGANYSDSGSNDSLNITWDFGDGSEPISFVNNPSHQFTKAGTHNVTVTITDNDGASTTDTISVTINNLAPTINTIDIPTNIKEGETVQLTANATDAGNDFLTYNWYINGATTPIIGQTIDYNFANSGTYPVKLEVIDSNGAITTQTVDATITNVAPTINQITIPTNIKEGDTIQLIATASDIGNDALTYNWYINNALTPITGATIDYTFTDNGIYPVKLEVIDTDGAVTTQTVDVTVANVAPAIVNIVKPTTINEGESVTFSATATDPGILDTLIYSWNFGDNTNPAIGQNVNHTFMDNGNYNRVLVTKQTFQTASNLWINLVMPR